MFAFTSCLFIFFSFICYSSCSIILDPYSLLVLLTLLFSILYIHSYYYLVLVFLYNLLLIVLFVILFIAHSLFLFFNKFYDSLFILFFVLFSSDRCCISLNCTTPLQSFPFSYSHVSCLLMSHCFAIPCLSFHLHLRISLFPIYHLCCSLISHCCTF